MSRSTSSRKIYLVLNSNIEIDMTPSWKTKETLNKFSKRKSKLKLRTNRLSSKKTEILTLRRCLRMPLSSRSSKPKRRKKPETLKRPLLMLLKHITKRLML
jgi:hypothetical protein